MRIDEVKFRQKVVPGDTFIFRVELLYPVRHGVSSMRLLTFVGDHIVSEATLQLRSLKQIINQNESDKPTKPTCTSGSETCDNNIIGPFLLH